MPPKAPAAAKPKRRPKLKWRTRDSQNSQLYNLQLDVNDLHQEIQQLEQMRSILRLQTRLNRGDDRDGSYIKVVREYHRVFRRGFHPVVAIAESADGNTTGAAPRLVDTMEFLSRVMDESVSIGRFIGLDMMRDQWTRYSAALSNLDLRHVSSTVLPQMDYVTPGGDVRPVAMVSSEATYESVVTLDTMQLMFPHVLERRRSVVEKLLGRPFSGLAHFDFVFDTNTHRVIGYDFRVDLFAAFARLLHDPEDLILLFDGATISEESLIGDLKVYRQGPSSPMRQIEDHQASQQQQHQQPQGGTETRGNQQPSWPRSTATITRLDDDETEPLLPTTGSQMVHNSPPTTDHTNLWPQRAVIDPVVLKYATRRSDDEERQRSRQLHSKLTSILDPADRVLLGSVESTALAHPPPTQLQDAARSEQSTPSTPWQFKIANILAAAEQEGDEGADTADRFFSASESATYSSQNQDPNLAQTYFTSPALGGNRGVHNEPSASQAAKKKRSNPFAPVDLV